MWLTILNRNYGFVISFIIFQIVMPPIMIPMTPTPMAKIRKFFFSRNFFYPAVYALIIDNVPSNASSNLTVSVAWFGKKFNVFEFCKLLIFPPRI